MNSPTRRLPGIAAAAVLARLPGIASAAVLAALMVLADPSAAGYADRVRDQQWQLAALHARTAWASSTGRGVVVAVLDSGVDAEHRDLAGQVLPGADFVDGSTDGRVDPVGHGTTVAALIAGRGDDTSGVKGIAPGAKILPVRVLDSQNRYRDAATVAAGLRWAVDHGATVVNMSLGGSRRSTELASAIRYALTKDVVVIACTGNAPDVTGAARDGTGGATGEPSKIWYPAREPGVVAVSGLAPEGASVTSWPGSLTGPATVLSAPAVDMLGAKPGGYWQVRGTSFAAPLVAATAALIRAKWPHLDAANVVDRLIETATDLGAPGRDPEYGYGEVDPARALTARLDPVRRNPLLPAVIPSPAPPRAGPPSAASAGAETSTTSTQAETLTTTSTGMGATPQDGHWAVPGRALGYAGRLGSGDAPVPAPATARRGARPAPLLTSGWGLAVGGLVAAVVGALLPRPRRSRPHTARPFNRWYTSRCRRRR